MKTKLPEKLALYLINRAALKSVQTEFGMITEELSPEEVVANLDALLKAHPEVKDNPRLHEAFQARRAAALNGTNGRPEPKRPS